MMEWMYDLPLSISGPVIIVALCTYSLTGMALFRRFVIPRMKADDADADFNGAMLQAVMVFYGLAVALIAVNVWETYGGVSKTVSEEATAVASLYRDISGYPEPIRGELQSTMREYLDYVIHEAWPIQEQGGIPTGGVEIMNRFQDKHVHFEPASDGQKILHAEALRAYNIMIQSRRMRIDSVGARLPDILWVIVIAGALISLCSSFFYRIHDVRLHASQIVLLSTFIGLILFMILALDRPFRGELRIRPDSYQLVRDQLMKP